MSVLAITEQRAGTWHRMSFETVAAAQQLAGELGTAASAAVLGHGVSGLAAGLAAFALERVYAVEHELLAEYTPDGYTLAVRQLLEAVAGQERHASVQHYLLLGPRGIGKTTVLLTLRERLREQVPVRRGQAVQAAAARRRLPRRSPRAPPCGARAPCRWAPSCRCAPVRSPRRTRPDTDRSVERSSAPWRNSSRALWP